MRAARSLLAAVGILAVVAGAPSVLWLLGRDLLPASWPHPQDVLDVLMRPDDGRLLIGVLMVLGMVAWAQLTVSIAAELTASLRRRPGRRVELPGLGASRLLASLLVAGLLQGGSAVASASPALPPLVAVAHVPAGDVAAGSSRAEAPSYIVQSRDTLWRIAGTTLGDPRRWREIFELNAGRGQVDGARLTASSLLHAGWILTLPADAAATAVVQPGDTLTGIAAERLGSAGAAGKLFDLNRGRVQPGGGRLEDPDVIRPGWRIALSVEPSDPSRPAAPVPVPSSPHTGPTSRPRPRAPAEAVPSIPAAPTAPPSTEPTAAVPTSNPAPTTTGPQSALPPPRTTSGVAPPTDGTESPSAAVEVLMPAAIGAGSLVIGGLLAALAVRRRHQLRHRRPHHRIAVPGNDSGRLERAATLVDPGLDASTLDAALRGLGLDSWDHTDPPDLVRVALEPERAELGLATATPPTPPFVTGHDGQTWLLTANATLPVPPGEAGALCAPFPTLVSVANAPTGAVLLLDLEALGVGHLAGPPARAVGLLRHIAVELANARWAEDVEVLMIGFGAELVPLNPERLRTVPDLPTALHEIRGHIARVSRALTVSQQPTVVHGRLRGVAPDAWLPLVVLAETDTESDDLAALAADLHGHRRAVAVLVHGASAGRAVTIDDDGMLRSGDGQWVAESMNAQVAAGLAGIMAPTGQSDIPAGRAVEPEPWAADMDEDGHLTDLPAVTEPPDRAAQAVLESVDHQDPHLDEDLARWHDPCPVVPMIGILGEPVVRAARPAPRRPSWFTEVLVHMALHPLGVTAQQALTDFWPDGHTIKTATVRSAYYGVRRWAGTGLDGNPDLPFVSDVRPDGTYRLRGHLLDWDLFRRLRKRAEARHAAEHPGAVGDYRAALALIRGPVLSPLRPGGYAWIYDQDQRYDLQVPGFLVDTAHDLAEIALAAGDLALAREAAETARRVDSDSVFDQPLTDLMRVAHAEGNPAEMERYAAALLDARDFDVPEELPPETFAVVNDLLPHGPRRHRPGP